MKKLKAWMTEHKKFSVIALCLLLMFTCGSAMSAINVSHHRAETAKEQNAGNNTDTTTAAEKKTKEETGKVELTDAQKEIIKGYDTDAKELIDTLSSSVWSVSEGRYTLKFADDSYVETVNGTPTVHSYGTPPLLPFRFVFSFRAGWFRFFLLSIFLIPSKSPVCRRFCRFIQQIADHMEIRC